MSPLPKVEPAIDRNVAGLKWEKREKGLYMVIPAGDHPGEVRHVKITGR